MDGASSRAEAFRPLLLKAGASLAVAALAAAYAYVRVAARKTNNDNTASKTESSPSSSSLASNELKHADRDDEKDENFQSAESGPCQQHGEADGDRVDQGQNEVVLVLGLVDQINEVRQRMEELEARFERYQSMKHEYEGLLIELQNTLNLEVARGDSLEKEVSSLEAEARRAQDWDTYGLNLLKRAENLEAENEILKKKVKRLSRRSREGAQVVTKQKLKIQESEAMITQSREEVAKGADLVNRMAEEIAELQIVADGLRREKMELSDKLKLAETSLTLKHEAEITTIYKYKHLINELKKLQKELAAEKNKRVYSRWTNACLRHQLMEAHESDIDPEPVPAGSSGEQQALLELDLHHELDRMAMDRDNAISPEVKTDRDSKRRALVQKLKKWVEGWHHHKMRVTETKSDSKCFGRHFSSDWVDEHVHGRKSFSSA